MNVTVTRTRRVPAVYVLSLMLADIGGAIPFGLASGPTNTKLNALEWVLSIVLAVAAFVLLLRLFGVLHRWADEALAVSAGAWVSAALYASILSPDFTWQARLGFGLIFVGYGVASGYAYALERAPRRS